MEDIKYRKYNRKEMLNIIRNDAFLFVESNLGDNYIIKKQDLPDFIVLEAIRTLHTAKLSVYIPGIASPVITTNGWFLNRANPLLREEIIKRLILLQTTRTKPKNVKVFDNDMFMSLSPIEKGIKDGKNINFDKFYKKYNIIQQNYNLELKGV